MRSSLRNAGDGLCGIRVQRCATAEKLKGRLNCAKLLSVTRKKLYTIMNSLFELQIFVDTHTFARDAA